MQKLKIPRIELEIIFPITKRRWQEQQQGAFCRTGAKRCVTAQAGVAGEAATVPNINPAAYFFDQKYWGTYGYHVASYWGRKSRVSKIGRKKPGTSGYRNRVVPGKFLVEQLCHIYVYFLFESKPKNKNYDSPQSNRMNRGSDPGYLMDMGRLTFTVEAH
uniref:Uncharacterized protein n=1 Tax=Romanomermis culicivorax TaxID=13658 RepID=A0A915HV19_ROMCU